MKKFLALAFLLLILPGCAVWKYKGRKTLLFTIGPAFYIDIDREVEAHEKENK